ncbi:hypothetical protein GCM10011409_23830 [Lentibacillus populi]|uniref:RNA polymerase sigma-70 region 2 domain-containing protein n=1 Tax=Lentibacillus populi TaxID=1827502 RepID=A0A9W5X5P3_9BACI|nr:MULTISPECIES: sigma factor [Bacillaceae]GGB45496.1 hypothetical protein GCM10011409_23830 [Lentibacillus populi]
MDTNITFEKIFRQNERRIHDQIHTLNIHNPHNEYFQEGLCAMWHAYEKYQPDKGPMATYFNFMIRNRLIDLFRKQTRDNANTKHAIKEQKTQIDDGNHFRHKETSYPLVSFPDLMLEDPYVWQNLKSELTEN